MLISFAGAKIPNDPLDFAGSHEVVFDMVNRGLLVVMFSECLKMISCYHPGYAFFFKI